MWQRAIDRPAASLIAHIIDNLGNMSSYVAADNHMAGFKTMFLHPQCFTCYRFLRIGPAFNQITTKPLHAATIGTSSVRHAKDYLEDIFIETTRTCQPDFEEPPYGNASYLKTQWAREYVPFVRSRAAMLRRIRPGTPLWLSKIPVVCFMWRQDSGKVIGC